MIGETTRWWLAGCGVTGLVVTLVATPLVCALSVRFSLVDRAAQFHHVHPVAVPRLGGVVLFGAFALVMAGIMLFARTEGAATTESWVIVLTSLAMFGLGFWDDLHPLRAKVKFVAQIGLAVAAYAGGLQISHWTNPFTGVLYDLGFLALPATVLWLVAITNLINLVDGVDGLAAGIALMLMVLLCYVGFNVGSVFAMFVAAGMAGALCGFLFYNFPPARIFMGDGGAYFMGFLIGELSLLSSNKGTVAAALIVPFFALGLPIIDASFAMVRRGLQGLPVFRADRRHIHHRLVARGLSQRRVVWILYAISAAFAVVALGGFVRQGRVLPILFGILMLGMVLAARAFGFVEDWYKLGYILTAAMRRRRATRFALALGHWLEMEGERCETMADLWKCFRFMLDRLGFNDVRLHPALDRVDWHLAGEVRTTMGDGVVLITYGGAKAIEVELRGPGTEGEGELLHLMAELAAEAWMKAVGRWNHCNRAKPARKTAPE